MTTLLDTLLIKIDGDARGIQSVIKGAVTTATGAVNQINKQEVDWTSIFSRSVTPAIIGSIASMFAFAIEQSLTFQQALNTTGTAAGDSSQQIAQLGKDSLGLSTIVPASAQDIANAMTQVGTVFGQNSTATQDLVQQMVELSASGFGPLSDIVSSSMEVFKQFGATTESSAVQVLTDLMHAAQGANESIPTLTSQFNTFATQLPGIDKTVSSFNGLISTFASEVVNLGSAGAEAIFQSLATSSSSAAGPMEILGISFGDIQKSLLTDGGLDALSRTSTLLAKMGPGANLVAQAFGFSAAQVSQFQTNANKLPQVAIDAQKIAGNTETIGDAYKTSSSSLRNLTLLWNAFVSDAIGIGNIFEPLVNGFAGALLVMNDDAKSFFKDITDGLGSAFSPLFGNNLVDAAKGTFDGLSKAFTLVTSGIQNQIVNGIGGALGITSGASSGLNSALQGTGVGFNTGTLGRIDQTASNSGLMDSLISALQTGIKGGQYTQLVNTFHLNVPAGAAGLTAKQIAQQLYNQFQGT